MEPLKTIIKKQTDNSPLVYFDELGDFFFIGNAVMPNAEAFCKPIRNWIFRYAENPAQSTHARFLYNKMNVKCENLLLDIFQVLDELRHKDRDVFVTWRYNSPRGMEVGENLQTFFRIPTSMKYSATIFSR